MFQALVLALIVVGPHVGITYVAEHPELPPAPKACVVENVPSGHGNYLVRHVVDDGKGCYFDDGAI